jgi:hypothetical protein
MDSKNIAATMQPKNKKRKLAERGCEIEMNRRNPTPLLLSFETGEKHVF